MKNTLKPNQVILIDQILNSSQHYGTHELYELMVDLIHTGITPGPLHFMNTKYLKPQLTKYLQENRQSEFLTELINEFDSKFVRPWFISNFEKFYTWFTVQVELDETSLWSDEFMCSYNEFKFNLIELFTDNFDDPYSFSFLDKAYRDSIETQEK